MNSFTQTLPEATKPRGGGGLSYRAYADRVDPVYETYDARPRDHHLESFNVDTDLTHDVSSIPTKVVFSMNKPTSIE